MLSGPEGDAVARAVMLWLGLLGAAGLILVATAAIARWQRRRSGAAPNPPVTLPRSRRPRPEELARLMAEVDALSTQAVSAGMAAAEAEVAVTTARDRCRAAEWARERAWDDYDAAHQAYVSALRADLAGEEVWPNASTSGAWPVYAVDSAQPADGAQPAAGRGATAVVTASAESRPLVPRPREALGLDREQEPGFDGEPDPRDELARAALAAYRRGGISVEQLREVLRHSSGWNQVHARHEREVLLRCAAERQARRSYNAAAAAERSAHLAVDVAVAAARAWADEAVAAAEDASLARAFAAECLRRSARRRRLRRGGQVPASVPA
jgi:hypothetical protein